MLRQSSYSYFKSGRSLFGKKQVLAVFLDVRGAFDNVVIDILLEILASIGCSRRLILFVKSLISERKIFADIL